MVKLYIFPVFPFTGLEIMHYTFIICPFTLVFHIHSLNYIFQISTNKSISLSSSQIRQRVSNTLLPSKFPTFLISKSHDQCSVIYFYMACKFTHTRVFSLLFSLQLFYSSVNTYLSISPCSAHLFLLTITSCILIFLYKFIILV